MSAAEPPDEEVTQDFELSVAPKLELKGTNTTAFRRVTTVTTEPPHDSVAAHFL